MPKTSKMEWVYPSEGQTSWYSIYQAFVNAVDADVYASLEDPHLVLDGGGMISLDTSTDTLSWSDDMALLSMLTGGSITIQAGSLAGFEDGKIAYLEISRPVSGTRVLTLGVADTLAGNRNRVFIALRRGTSVFMRNAANRSNVGTVDFWGSNYYSVPLSVVSGGGERNGTIPVGVNKGTIWKVRITALQNTTDATIRFFTDATETEELWSVSNQDCYTTPYEDGTSWFMGVLTGGNLYYRVTNDGANSSYFRIELIGIGDAD